MQRPKRRAAGHGLICRVGARERLLGHEGDDGVDLRIHGLDAVEMRLDHFAGRELLCSDEGRKRGRLLIVDGAGVCDRLVEHGRLLLAMG